MDRKKISSAMPYLKAREAADGMESYDCPPDKLLETAEVLKDDYEFQTLDDIAAIDMGPDRPSGGRFGAVYHFYSHTRKLYLRLCAMCADNEEPKLPSLTGLYLSADWAEREAYDLMGIVFEGHPHLARILMWDGYPYHPLRKDFPLAGLPAPLPDSFDGNYEATEVKPAPMEGGPFKAPQGDSFAEGREPRSRAQI